MTIVVTVSEYDGPPEEALREITDAQTLYEGFSHVYVAESLDDLPHPMQIEAVREHFGDTNSNFVQLNIPDYGKYTVRRDMDTAQQVDQWKEIAAENGLEPAQIDRGINLIQGALSRVEGVHS